MKRISTLQHHVQASSTTSLKTMLSRLFFVFDVRASSFDYAVNLTLTITSYCCTMMSANVTSIITCDEVNFMFFSLLQVIQHSSAAFAICT